MEMYRYKRWDETEIDFEVDDFGKIKEVKRQDEAIMFTCSDIHLDETGKLYIGIKSNNEGEEDRKIFFGNKRDFYSALEGKRKDCGKEFQDKILYIDSLSEYIQAIDYYRYVSLLEHLQTLKQMKGEEKEKLKKIIRDQKAELYACSNEELQKKIIELFNGLKEVTKNESIVSSTVKPSFSRGMRIYDNGGSFCYYRGIGHVFYPEMPGIYRKSNIHEEARWYRMMKTNFHDNLDELHYLDRLAMLQHYELPTRLLDVTSNPLVALYMAVNRIYIKDDVQQSDYGEVVAYFDELSDSKAYDSNSVLVLAALAKLSYEAQELMYTVLSSVQQRIEEIAKAGVASVQELKDKFCYCVQLCAETFNHRYVFCEEEKTEVNRGLPNEIESPKDICQGLDMEQTIKDSFPAFIVAYIKLLGTVRRENPAFTNFIDVFMLMKAFHVRIGMTNDRIRAQAGSFIICGLDKNYINSKMKSSRRELIRRMFITDKKAIYNQLNAIAINDMTMLPDMAHQAQYIQELSSL